MTFDRNRLTAARLRAAESQPFLTQALYALTPVDNPGSGTFGVDEQLRLHVDGAALDRWTIPECAGVLLHEVGHVIRDHAGRARSLGVGPDTRHRWNVAADAEINDDLLADGVTLPEGGITPARLGLAAGRAAEYYYHALTEIPDGPDCGPGCHGQATTRSAPGGPTGTEGPPGLAEVELLVLRRRVADAAAEAARHRPGSVVGGWTRWAQAVLEPVLDWRIVLQALVRRAVADVAGRVDYSYRRPGRRRVERVVLPAMRRPLPAVAVVIDVSGSVTSAELSAAWSEVSGCLRSIGIRRDLLRVYATDVETTRITDLTARRVPLTGGGGTDLRHGIQTALAARPRPGVVVAITDGWTPWPTTPTSAALVVALLNPSEEGLNQPPPPPAWARVVPIR